MLRASSHLGSQRQQTLAYDLGSIKLTTALVDSSSPKLLRQLTKEVAGRIRFRCYSPLVIILLVIDEQTETA